MVKLAWTPDFASPSSVFYKAKWAAERGRGGTKKLGNNTYLEIIAPPNDEDDSGKVCVRLHRTYIVCFNQDGSINFDTGGWSTRTTMMRLNEFLPLRVWTQKGDHYIGGPEGKAAFAERGVVWFDDRIGKWLAKTDENEIRGRSVRDLFKQRG